MKRKILPLLLLVIAIFLFTGVVFATIVVRMTVSQMVNRAQLVVEGTITETRARWDENHRYIITEAQVKISRTLKGKAGTSTITVRTLGGEVDGLGLYVAGAPKFKVGEEALLFLERHPVKDWRVVGLSQGKFTLITDKRTGSKMAVSSATSEMLPLEVIENQILNWKGGGR